MDEQILTESADKPIEPVAEGVNPYLEELKQIAALHKLVAGARTITFVGVPRHIVKERRAKNYRSRASRRFNRLRAKGKI